MACLKDAINVPIREEIKKEKRERNPLKIRQITLIKINKLNDTGPYYQLLSTKVYAGKMSFVNDANLMIFLSCL